MTPSPNAPSPGARFPVRPDLDRRGFLLRAAAAAAGLSLSANAQDQVPASRPKRAATVPATKPRLLYDLSLAQWSVHRALRDGTLDNLDFAKVARKHGIHAIEYVNQFFMAKIKDRKYVASMKQRADDEGVRSLLIMCDGLGRLGDPEDGRRKRAVERHVPVLEAAKFLGCHSIRVNAASSGSYDQQLALAADGLAALATRGKEFGLNVLVENHGGLSSNGAWLAAVMRKVAMTNCGTLPDFGNFRVAKDKLYDRYKGVAELMPFAKAVSAKSYDFDEDGQETKIDYLRMLRIVTKGGYHGHLGIEYEGSRLSEDDGIAATKKLLLRVRDQLAAANK